MMMLIFGDETHRHGRFPWVTGFLIVVHVVVFVAQAFLGEPVTNGFSLVPREITSLEDFTRPCYVKAQVGQDQNPGHGWNERGEAGLVTGVDAVPGMVSTFEHLNDTFSRQGAHDSGAPANPFAGRSPRSGSHLMQRPQLKVVRIQHYPGPAPIFLTLLTSLFLHNHAMHLILNMWFLLIFGRNIECALGHARFAAFYIACGVCAGLVHVAVEPHSVIPRVLASGALAGVLGAYLAIHPINRIKVLAVFVVIEIQAWLIIAYWFVLQFLFNCMTLKSENLDGVPYWCHLAGFVAGIAIIRGIVLYLQCSQVVELVKEALVEADETPPFDAASTNEDPRPANNVQADPYAVFLSIPTAPVSQQPTPD